MKRIVNTCIVVDIVIVLLSVLEIIALYEKGYNMLCFIYAVVTVLAIYELIVVKNM